MNSIHHVLEAVQNVCLSHPPSPTCAETHAHPGRPQHVKAEAYVFMYVEPLSEARTRLLRQRRVSARQGWAGETAVFNSFLLVVFVVCLQSFLSLLLLHCIVQEHADKH